MKKQKGISTIYSGNTAEITIDAALIDWGDLTVPQQLAGELKSLSNVEQLTIRLKRDAGQLAASIASALDVKEVYAGVQNSTYAPLKNTKMALTRNEPQRLAELESIRTPDNSVLIDAAITSGKTAEAVAFDILSDRAIANGKSMRGDELSNMIAASINSGRTASMDEANASTDSLVDIIASSANSRRRPEE